MRRTVFYFDGGAFVEPAAPAHSFACSILAHLLDARVLMLPYALAPTGLVASELPRIVAFYAAVAKRKRTELGHEIIVAGDR